MSATNVFFSTDTNSVKRSFKLPKPFLINFQKKDSPGEYLITVKKPSNLPNNCKFILTLYTPITLCYYSRSYYNNGREFFKGYEYFLPGNSTKYIPLENLQQLQLFIPAEQNQDLHTPIIIYSAKII